MQKCKRFFEFQTQASWLAVNCGNHYTEMFSVLVWDFKFTLIGWLSQIHLIIYWFGRKNTIYCIVGSEARNGSAVSTAVWDGENAGPIQGTGIPQRSAHGKHKTTEVLQDLPFIFRQFFGRMSRALSRNEDKGDEAKQQTKSVHSNDETKEQAEPTTSNDDVKQQVEPEPPSTT